MGKTQVIEIGAIVYQPLAERVCICLLCSRSSPPNLVLSRTPPTLVTPHLAPALMLRTIPSDIVR